ncbi:MAG: polysaccharide deacetylase family protein [Vicinamibacterales bacterium]
MSGCLVAMYHYVRDSAATAFPGVNALAVADFDRQLDALAAAGAPVTCEGLVTRLDAGRPFERPSLLLTFDDGFVDHYTAVFPRLADRGWSGVFFLAGDTLGDRPRVLNVHKTHFLVSRLGAAAFAAAVREAAARVPAGAGAGLRPTPAVYRYDAAAGDRDVKHLLNYELPFETADRVLDELFTTHIGDETEFARALYLSGPMIREMAAAGMTFGYHTARHRVLSRLDVAGQRTELAGGVARIRALTGQALVPFCYPYGHPHTYTAETVAVLADLGYACAFTTVRRLARPESDGRFEVPRYDTRDLPPFTSDMPHA